MRTEKVTIRLPEAQIVAIDLFIKMGEFASRSEAIRRAINMLIDDMMQKVEKKAEMWKKIYEIESLAEVSRLKKE